MPDRPGGRPLGGRLAPTSWIGNAGTPKSWWVGCWPCRRQSPRTCDEWSALWIVGDVHRMGVLAIHVAQATLRRYPEPVLPVTVRPVFAGWARIGEQLAGHAATAARR